MIHLRLVGSFTKLTELLINNLKMYSLCFLRGWKTVVHRVTEEFNFSSSVESD